MNFGVVLRYFKKKKRFCVFYFRMVGSGGGFFEVVYISLFVFEFFFSVFIFFVLDFIYICLSLCFSGALIDVFVRICLCL